MLTLSFFIAFIFCVAIGVAAILVGHHLIMTYNNSFLRNYFYYLIAFYAFAFYGIWAQLVVHWSLSFISVESDKVVLIASFLPALGIPFLVISWIMLIKVVLGLLDERAPINELILHGIVLGITLISSIGIYFAIKENQWWSTENIIIIEAIGLQFIDSLYILGFIGLALYGNNTSTTKAKHLILPLTWIMGAGLILRIMVVPLAVYASWFLAPAILIYFLSNIFPILYLKHNADRVLIPIGVQHPNKNKLELIIKKHQVTKREQEIIAQICLGKTNQQIADELFISLQTVKDHNHRIFSKLGVNNRLQLVKMVGTN